MSKISVLCSAAVILAASGASAQMARQNQPTAPNPCACLEQGMGLPKDKKCYPPAYNAPANISVSCGWDVDIFASFLYWFVGEDGLNVVAVRPAVSPSILPGVTAFQDQTWKPGFQVGFGFDTGYDNWIGWVEYTWMHQSTDDTLIAPNTPSGAAGAWTNPDTVIPFYLVNGAPTANLVTSTWKMHLDMVDAFFSRPYYQGTQLTISPYAGLRALWIRQTSTGRAPSLSERISINTNSWGIGPAAGVEGHWLLGMGFRFEGNATGALLYTQYTKLGWSFAQPSLGKVTADNSDLNTVRAMAQLGVGLGWGSYIYCQSYYIDFSARYDFNYFWSQNMMHYYVTTLLGANPTAGDLYMHGLTLSGSFSF